MDGWMPGEENLVMDFVKAFKAIQIEELYINLPSSRDYRSLDAMLPYLQDFASDSRVVCLGYDETHDLQPDDVNVLVRLLQQPLSIELNGIWFPAGDRTREICAGFANSRVTSLCLSEVAVDGVPLADALGICNVPSITVERWPLYDGPQDAIDFFSNFARLVPTMRSVKVDLVKLFHGCDDDTEETPLLVIDQALPGLLQAVAGNPKLCVLGLPSFQVSATMDRALAGLVRSSSKLQELTLCCSTRNRDRIMKAPHLFQALKSCSSSALQTIKFDWIRRGSDDLLWDDDLLAQIETVLRLNRSGRSYLHDDSTDQRANFQVLEKVNDDLECLFFHVRENPTLSRRHATSEQQPGDESRKRKCEEIST